MEQETIPSRFFVATVRARQVHSALVCHTLTQDTLDLLSLSNRLILSKIVLNVCMEQIRSYATHEVYTLSCSIDTAALAKIVMSSGLYPQIVSRRLWLYSRTPYLGIDYGTMCVFSDLCSSLETGSSTSLRLSF